MIVNRGAVEAALKTWNDRRRQIFFHKTDTEVDPAALRAQKEKLAGINANKIAQILDQDVRSIEFLPNAGTFHAVFRVPTPAKTYFLKLALEETNFGFAIETWASKHIKLAPKIEAFEVITQTLPCPFLITEAAEGKMLRDFENPETQAMPPPLLFEFGKSLAQVHQTLGHGAGLLDAGASKWPFGLKPDWMRYLTLRLEEHLRICRDIGAISDPEVVTITRHFSEPHLGAARIRLLHGDPGHHNAFSDGRKITELIDWEDALCGDPIFDIAFWGTFVRDQMREPFLSGYETIEKLPSDFEYRYWLYYLRVALSKTVHRHRFGAKDRPGRPPASQRIQKALSNLAKL